jgi:hypothetical protein
MFANPGVVAGSAFAIGAGGAAVTVIVTRGRVIRVMR